MKQSILSIGLVAFLVGCSSAPTNPTSRTDYMTGATAWYQNAGEARALMYQAFHLARLVLDNDLKVRRKKSELPPAVIVDIDETVLDNSPFQGRAVATGESYPKGWSEWVKLARAKPVAGAVEFLNYAYFKGLRVFYVTNRKDSEKTDTAKNLTAAGFPDVSDATVLCRTTDMSKEPRRQQIREKYRVVFLMGDNLTDFAAVYEKKPTADRLKTVEETKDKFGSEYLVLPNPMYGDWEAALYQYNFNRSDAELDKLRKDAIQSFSY